MKGELHQRLRAAIQAALEAKICTQESLGIAMGGKSQRSVGQYAQDDAGALDLDEAVAALEHIGSTLPNFVAGLPPREMSPTERLARALVTRPELALLVEDLLPVPKKKLSDVIELARGLGRVAKSPRGGETRESNSSRQPARHTTKGRGKRR